MGNQELAQRLARGHVDCYRPTTVEKLLRAAAAKAWEEGRCAAARGQRNNPYIDNPSKDGED